MANALLVGQDDRLSHAVSPRRWTLVVASFAATLGISAYVLWSGWARAGAPPTIPLSAHLLALTCVLAEIATRSVKIHWSAAALRIPLRFGTALRVCLGGDFGASITPSRSGAEPARFLVLAEAGVPPAGTLLILFTELFLEMSSLALLCALLILVLGGTDRVGPLMAGMVGGYAVIVLSIGAFGYFLAHRNSHGPPPPWATFFGLHAGRWRAVQRSLRSLRASIAALGHARIGPMVAAFVASMIHVSLRLALLPVIALAMDPTLPFAKLVLWPLVFLYGGAVAPAPGGGGAVEYAFTLAFTKVMSPAVLGGALVWWRFYSFYLYVVFGGLAAGGTALKALRDEPDVLVRRRARPPATSLAAGIRVPDTES